RFLHRGESETVPVSLTDAGGGTGPWTVTVQTQSRAGGTTVSAPATISVPGSLALHASATSTARQGDTAGFVVLSRATATPRIPFWLRATAPQLRAAPHRTLTPPGLYHRNPERRASPVASYPYPSTPSALGIAPRLRGPEQVFRFLLRPPVQNFGVAVLSRGRGVLVQGRVARAG